MTDDWDRRVLYTYVNDFFKDEALESPYFKSVVDNICTLDVCVIQGVHLGGGGCSSPLDLAVQNTIDLPPLYFLLICPPPPLCEFLIEDLCLYMYLFDFYHSNHLYSVVYNDACIFVVYIQ